QARSSTRPRCTACSRSCVTSVSRCSHSRNSRRKGNDMEPTNTRKLALAAGVLYLVTFAASLPTLGLKAPLVDHADWILGGGSGNRVIFAGLLDFVCAVAGIGTAVALYPIIRRSTRVSAIGFITTRTLEAAILVVGAISLLSVVTLRSQVVGADTASLMA